MENITSTNSKPKKTATIPTSNVNLVSLAEVVSKKWIASPEITLKWITAADFATLVSQLRTSLTTRLQAGGNRKPQTQQLKDLDAELNKAIENLKVAIQYKFGKEQATAYFLNFGITKNKSNSYKLPADRNERIAALEMVISGINTYQIKVTGYKDNYFSDFLTKYKALLSNVQSTDSTVSSEVGNINELKDKIVLVLNSLVMLIKANNPYTYQTELRNWGFQKEKY
ncbi:MAG: hypothetical protein OHK0038_27860 [Flammeovirgaceae bacterium]